MQLRFEVTSDDLILHLLMGPGETYKPEDNPKITELHKEVMALKTEIDNMRAKIDPKMDSIKTKVMEINKELNK